LYEFSAWLEARRGAMDRHLEGLFTDRWPEGFSEALRYPLFGGGKRFRPLLAQASAEALGADPDAPAVLHAAGAVELIHTNSLVHDDLPAMDDDDFRRGRPTVHKVYGEAVAILVGDALLTEAFVHLVSGPGAAATKAQMVGLLGQAAGHQGMVGGQAADVARRTDLSEAELGRLHGAKTGALIVASCQLGALAAGADPQQLTLLGVYGRAVGLGFQLADDVLDAEQDQGDEGQPSYVKLFGVEGTRARAQACAAQAIAAASELPHHASLVALARYTVDREV
jgi:geranylgeranyl pyrophosphate synthase